MLQVVPSFLATIEYLNLRQEHYQKRCIFQSYILVDTLIKFLFGKIIFVVHKSFHLHTTFLHESSVRNPSSPGTLKIKIVVWGLRMMLWVGPAALIIRMA